LFVAGVVSTSAHADKLSGLSDVTVVDGEIISFRHEGTEYVVADGDMELGTDDPCNKQHYENESPGHSSPPQKDVEYRPTGDNSRPSYLRLSARDISNAILLPPPKPFELMLLQ
jgi:hypothetical protein